MLLDGLVVAVAVVLLSISGIVLCRRYDCAIAEVDDVLSGPGEGDGV